MCGIAGFAGCGDRGVIASMTAALAHRGPDGDGFYEDLAAGVFLGHRRLSILDIAGGSQPMWTPDGKVGVIFNGEIYNHFELRERLQALGRKFVSDHSDTEVLLQGYLEWGEELVQELNGMWAFVIYDRSRKRLFGSRDRFGKKPFYYFECRETFAWASELTALMRHPSAPRTLSQRALRKFFAYGSIPTPLTAMEGVNKLPGGHSFIFDLQTRKLRLMQYWDFVLEPQEPHEPDSLQAEQSLAAELRTLLEAATKRRLLSADVPVGIFLSGGIDSSAIAAFASRTVPAGTLQTFSIGFTEHSFDELAYANRVAALLGTHHHTETLDLAKTLEFLPVLMEKLDEPQGDSSLLPTWLLSRFTQSWVTVALGGDGGDELFAGYDPFAALAAADAFSRWMPQSLHPALRLLASWLPVSHHNVSWDFKIKRALRGLSYEKKLWNPIWLGALEPHEIADFLGGSADPEELYSEAIAIWEGCASQNLGDQTLQFFTKIYLQNSILPKMDRASMMHSLEVRSPFLDIEVVDFARRLPYRYKLHRGVRKYLLKKALEPLLPPDILYRKKKGFGTPIGTWFQQGALNLSSQVRFALERQARHRKRKSDERLFLWCQWVWEHWSAAHKEWLTEWKG